MRRGMTKRLTKIEHVFGSVPIPQDVRKAAFECFRETGVLPEDERLAFSVIDHAKTGYDCLWSSDGAFDWAASVRLAMETPKRTPDPLLDELYNEAIFGQGLVRWAARYLLEAFASIGINVTEPLFLDWDPEVPDYGSVGLHVLGFPERLVQPPYVDQAERLLVRTAELRKRIPDRGRAWAESLVDAAEDWRTYGELPEDELLRESVLIEGELSTLMDHFIGKDVSAVMAAYEQVAQTGGHTSAIVEAMRAAS